MDRPVARGQTFPVSNISLHPTLFYALTNLFSLADAAQSVHDQGTLSIHSPFSMMLSGLPNFRIHPFRESRPSELGVNMDHPARSWRSAAFTPGLEDFAINAACQFFANSHGYCARKA